MTKVNRGHFHCENINKYIYNRFQLIVLTYGFVGCNFMKIENWVNRVENLFIQEKICANRISSSEIEKMEMFT